MTVLGELRQQIDEVDDEILKLVAKRVELAKQIGQAKDQNDLRVYDPTREMQVTRRWTAALPGSAPDMARIAQAVISLCRRVQ